MWHFVWFSTKNMEETIQFVWTVNTVEMKQQRQTKAQKNERWKKKNERKIAATSTQFKHSKYLIFQH